VVYNSVLCNRSYFIHMDSSDKFSIAENNTQPTLSHSTLMLCLDIYSLMGLNI